LSATKQKKIKQAKIVVKKTTQQHRATMFLKKKEEKKYEKIIFLCVSISNPSPLNR